MRCLTDIMTLKKIVYLSVASSLAAVSAWVSPPVNVQRFGARSAKPNNEDIEEDTFDKVLDNAHACWQDIYDDDCGMGTMYSGHFVAKDWIKSMPCGKGMEDCDMPEELGLPGPHDSSGVESTDVMDMLGLKRVKSL